MGRRIILACQTLGVVFGDVGTSPLYTFDVMFARAPIHTNDDVVGALSLVLYTLILIPLVKYVLVVLWANDDGEGMPPPSPPPPSLSLLDIYTLTQNEYLFNGFLTCSQVVLLRCIP